ncbi:unnamed protein product [Calypogeia fissa]
MCACWFTGEEAPCHHIGLPGGPAFNACLANASGATSGANWKEHFGASGSRLERLAAGKGRSIWNLFLPSSSGGLLLVVLRSEERIYPDHLPFDPHSLDPLESQSSLDPFLLLSPSLPSELMSVLIL